VSPGPARLAPAGDRARRNLLVLLADQFRGDLLGVNGSRGCRTPALDRLAAGGVSLGHAYTVTPLCTPARAALFTGRFPRRAAPDETLVSHADVTPTVLDLLGVPPLPDAPPFQGQSVAARLRGGVALDRPAVFAETCRGDRINPQRDTRAIITHRHKYVFRPDDVDELYDLVADPEELCNLAPGDGPAGETAGRLRDALWRRMRETHDPLGAGADSRPGARPEGTP
jgi:arylsulfatase A-like enzyme